MEKNIIHNIDFLNNSLPDKCANLIIADPPYYEVKGNFDFIWQDFNQYLKDVEKWALECKRLLADNGTMFWYGDSKNLAYSQIIIDKHFNLINNLVWNKGSFMGLEESEGLRMFAPCSERLLMYSKETTFSDYERIIYGLSEYTLYMNNVKDKLSLNLKELNNDFGYVAGCSWWFSKKQPRLINEKDYNKLKVIYPEFNKDYKDIKRTNEKRLNDYDEKRRPFNNMFKLQEVLNFSNEAQKTGKNYDHDTVKPETLTRALILTCSRENDLVVVPFAGSGTECAMSVKEKRNFVGFEITPKHAEMSNKRVQKILKEPTLF